MRIEPLDESDWDDNTRSAALAMRPNRSGGRTDARPWDPAAMPVNEWADVLARHPALVAVWWPLNTYMVTRGSLPVRDRELAILRIAWLCQSPYQWKTHSVMAPALGLDPAEVDRVRAGSEADGWSEADRAVLRAVDELHRTARVGDETWAALAARWDERQLIELPFLVGQYQTFAFALNTLGVVVPEWDAPIA